MGLRFIIPSIYGYKLIQNRFCYNMENSPQNIRGYADIFTVLVVVDDSVESGNDTELAATKNDDGNLPVIL